MRRTVGIAAGIIGAGIIVFAAASCGDSTAPNPPTYTATLSGANEKPNAITSPGTGVATFVDLGTEIDWTLQFDGLTNAFASHIHGPGDANTVASVIINLFLPIGNTGAPKPITMQGVINNNSNINVSLDSLRTLFNNGKAYVNIHTTANNGGEIRGQVARSN
jgi:CHRD domain-containing protein